MGDPWTHKQIFGGGRPAAARKAYYELEQAKAALAEDHAMSNTYDAKLKRVRRAEEVASQYYGYGPAKDGE